MFSSKVLNHIGTENITKNMRQVHLQDLYAQVPLCIQHGLQVTHLCCQHSCTYSFLCSQCLISNQKHLQQHHKSIEQWGWFDLRIQENMGLDIIGKAGALKMQLDSLSLSLPFDSEFMRTEILEVFRQTRERMQHEITQLQQQFLIKLDQHIEEVKQFVTHKRMELNKLEEAVTKASNLKKEEYQELLRKGYQKSKNQEFVRMKTLFKKMLLQVEDYSSQEMELANHTQQIRGQQTLYHNKFGLKLKPVQLASFPISFEDVYKEENTFLTKQKREFRAATSELFESNDSRTLQLVKTLTLPHKPTAVYLSDTDKLSLLFKYRSGSDTFGLTETLNLFTKAEEDLFQVELSRIIEEYKLTGRVFQLTQDALFIGTREGMVRPIQLRPFRYEAPPFKASKHRVTYVHYCQCRNQLYSGSEKGSVTAWENWFQTAQTLHKYVNIVSGSIIGLVSNLQYLLVAGENELLLVDHYRKETVLSLSHGLSHSPYHMPMSNSLVMLPDKDEQRPGFILMATNNDKRICLFILKHKQF